MIKRIAVLFLAVALCLGGTTMASAGYQVRYGDAAAALWEDGLFLGDGVSFNLDQPLSRAEGVTMLVRVLGKDAEAKAGTWATPFTDLGDWMRPYVGYAYANGLTSGTGATTFSPGDPMTATQFLTLILRALGYDDKAGDFQWDKAAVKALEVGLIGQSCYKEYTTTNQFLRDNAAQISYTALGLNKKGSTSSLRSTITVPGKPAGNMPAYTASSIGAASSSTDSDGRTWLTITINGTPCTEVRAYKDTTIFLPIEYLARACGKETSYDPNTKNGTLSVKVSPTSSYSFSVGGGSLRVVDSVAYALSFSGVFGDMGLTVTPDENAGVVRITGNLSQPPAGWSTVTDGGNGVANDADNTGTKPSTSSGTPDTKACLACEGKGKVKCGYCGGTGWSLSNGGSTRCSHCGFGDAGTGWNTCGICHGSGTLSSDVGNTRCSTCDGSGRMTCPTCNGRRGYDKEEIGYRGVKYTVFVNCSTCSATGKVSCTTCGGDGYK